MLSDTLFDAECEIRRYQREFSYDHLADRINRLRCELIILRLELDARDPMFLDGNPIYEACKRGDPSLHDRHMDGDDSVIAEWREKIGAILQEEAEYLGKRK
jgi:hypothetical protein